MAATTRTTEKTKALDDLRSMLKPGDTVYTILRHVSGSGMTRHISVLVLRNSERLYLTYAVAKALGEKLVESHGFTAMKVQGCGMDMGFSVVYDLGRVLFPDGFDTPPGYRRNQPLSHDPDGGYAFKHAWL